MTEPTNTPSEDNAAPAAESTEAVTNGTPAPTMSPAAQHQLAALMNREKAVRTQETQMKAQAADLQRLQEQLRQQQTPEEPKEPHAVNASELEKLRAELQEFKERDETYRSQTVVAEERARFRSELAETDGIEAVKAAEAYDVVFDHVLEHYNKTGEWISEAEAAKTVNTQLVALAEKLAPLVAKTSPAAPPSMDLLEVAQTLNQSMTSEAGGQSNTALSQADINKRAADMLRFKTR